MVVIAVSASSIIIYGIVALFTYSRILAVRQKPPQTSYPDDGTALLTEDEMQRRQLLKLLMNKDADRAPTPELIQGTFHIDLPETVNPGWDRYNSLPESTYERRTVVVPPPGSSAELHSPWERDARRAEIERPRRTG